jgi:hypothetical protein
MKKLFVWLVAISLLLLSSMVTHAAQTGSYISSFTSSVNAVDRTALTNRTARIPVAWTTSRRPDGTNLVFEQLLPDGRVLNVELPRDNPYVASNGQGVAAPFAPGGNETTIALRVSLIDLATQVSLDDRQILLAISDVPGSSASIRTFTASVNEVSAAALANRTARVPVTWAVDNRPEGSNLSFEQVLADGTVVNVELPRNNPFVASSGVGVAAPIPPGGNATTILLRLRLINLSNNTTITQSEITLNVSTAPTPTVTIRTFTAGTDTVSAASLANRSARVPVSWAVDNRPDGSNLVFEQILADNSVVNVELPRDNPFVSSSGNGVAAPVPPGGAATTITLRLRVVDLASQNTLAQQTVSLTVSNVVVAPGIRTFTTSATNVAYSTLVNRSARVPVSWSVENRPDGSNLVFEQQLEDGSRINVELPRNNPFVSSSGNGVASPTVPQNVNTSAITLVLRLVNLADQSTLTQQTLQLTVVGQAVPPPATVPPVTTGARAIFIKGQQMGNRANVFSKVGDSLTDSQYFLRQFTGSYNLRAFNAMQPVVNYFASQQAYDANSFGTTSRAARASWSSFSVLDPRVADVGICQSGETPLACEYRLNKPVLALIMVGTNDIPSFPATTYESNLRQIIEITINAGVIPVVSTLPPRPDYPQRVNEYNAVVVRLTQEYNIPIWDLNKELVKLSNGGIGPDNVHLSVPPAGSPGTADFTLQNLQYGTTMRNLTALQILDFVWRTAIQ